MLRVDEDTFTMISGLIFIAVAGIAGLLALGWWLAAGSSQHSYPPRQDRIACGTLPTSWRRSLRR